MATDFTAPKRLDENMVLPQPYTRDQDSSSLKMPPLISFMPLTKEDVAKVFDVTPRTIENWVEHEDLPAPVRIGNRVYWHPEEFNAWLDKRLRSASKAAPKVAVTEVSTIRGAARSADRERLRKRTADRIAAIEASPSLAGQGVDT